MTIFLVITDFHAFSSCVAGGGGMCGRGHTCQGACMTGGPRGIRSMSGRYASYWNAFFFRMSHLTILTLSELPTAELLDLRSYKQ